MADQIEEHRIRKYATGIDLLAQQRFTRFRMAVRVENDVNAKISFWDQMGSIEMTKKTGRHTATPAVDMPHKRRALVTAAYETGALVDEVDLTTVLNDPTGAYGETMASAAGRKQDDVIIAAATASAKTGEDGDVLVPHPAAFKVPVDTGPMTLAKALHAKRILDQAEVDESRTRHAFLKANQYEQILAIEKFTSADYTTVQALVQGDLKSYLGFQWGRSERLLPDGSADIQCLFYAQDSILLGVATDVTARVGERADLSYDTQVYYKMVIGATRMDETGVVTVQCTPT